MNRAAAWLFLTVNLIFNFGPLLLLGLVVPPRLSVIMMAAGGVGIVWLTAAHRGVRQGYRWTIILAMIESLLSILGWIFLCLIPFLKGGVGTSVAAVAAPIAGVAALAHAGVIHLLFKCHVDPELPSERMWYADSIGMFIAAVPCASLVGFVNRSPLWLGTLLGLPQALLTLVSSIPFD